MDQQATVTFCSAALTQPTTSGRTPHAAARSSCCSPPTCPQHPARLLPAPICTVLKGGGTTSLSPNVARTEAGLAWTLRRNEAQSPPIVGEKEHNSFGTIARYARNMHLKIRWLMRNITNKGKLVIMQELSLWQLEILACKPQGIVRGSDYHVKYHCVACRNPGVRLESLTPNQVQRP